jgi:phosphoribosylamine---glycine ligase
VKVLFISNNLIAADVARLIKEEGHDVKLFIDYKNSKQNFDNIVSKTANWKKELKWVGKDGLIIFDDVGYGKVQDSLRKKGYTVFGGSELTDRLETEREFGQKILKDLGIETVELKDFADMDDAVNFVKKNPKAWVIKQNDHGSKNISYIGQFPDGRDVISMLKNYLQDKNLNREKITLQERVYGVEIGVGRYFNGDDWIGPIEFNIEHKPLFNNDVGPLTSEMGTLAWYDNNENNKLYKETLAKLKPFLQKAGFHGDMEINFIVDKNHAYPLEATPRFGSPIVHLQSEIHSSPWGEFLCAVASGEKFNLKWKKGYGIVVLIATPPFPFSTKKQKNNEHLLYGVNIYFDNISKEEMSHVHLEDVSKRVKETDQLYISGKYGYVLYTTAIADSVKEAQEKVYNLTKKIVIPKMFYRTDIGESFTNSNYKKLKDWGWL